MLTAAVPLCIHIREVNTMATHPGSHHAPSFLIVKSNQGVLENELKLLKQ